MKYIVANLGVHLHSLPKPLISGKKWTSLQATLRIPVRENCFQSPCWHALHRSSTSSMLLLFILFYYSLLFQNTVELHHLKPLRPWTSLQDCCFRTVWWTHPWPPTGPLARWRHVCSLTIFGCLFPRESKFLGVPLHYSNYTPKTYPNSQLPRFLPYIPRLVHDFHWHHARCALFPPDFPAPGSALPLRKCIHEKLRPTAYLPILFHSKPWKQIFK